MPGTIVVTVLEIMGLPLSSSTSIKVSMGKVEHQIRDKGDFSFPLTSLRDDLIVKLHDADGNEISRTGVQVKSIVEKGVWQDVFPLEGGHLHLKMQFILNDEERDRIRMMRQSALKKKHNVLLSSPKFVESRNASAGDTELALSTNNEVSEIPKKHLQPEALHVKTPVGFCNDKNSGIGSLVGVQPDKKQLIPNIADQHKETPSTMPAAQSVDLTQLQHRSIIKKPTILSPLVKDPQRAIGSEEKEIILRSSEQNVVAMNNPIHPTLVEDRLHYPERQSTPGKTSSKVSKMISAFESGLAQDRRSHMKPPSSKYQSSEIETNSSFKTQHSEEDKAQNTEPAGFFQGEWQQAPTYIREGRDHIKFITHISEENRQLGELSTIRLQKKQLDLNARNKFKVAQKSHTDEEKHNTDLMRTSIDETVTVSGKELEKHSSRNHPSHLLGCKQDSRTKPSKEEKSKRVAYEDDCKLFIQGASPHKLDSVVHYEDKYYMFESSRAWIFPDEQKKLCLATGGKKAMDLLETKLTKSISHQRSLDLSVLGSVDENAVSVGSETETEVRTDEKICKIEESNANNSNDNNDEISAGPVRQVIKVAIIIGFGILVFLTRQRKSRNRSGKDVYQIQ